MYQYILPEDQLVKTVYIVPVHTARGSATTPSKQCTLYQYILPVEQLVKTVYIVPVHTARGSATTPSKQCTLYQYILPVKQLVKTVYIVPVHIARGSVSTPSKQCTLYQYILPVDQSVLHQNSVHCTSTYCPWISQYSIKAVYIVPVREKESDLGGCSDGLCQVVTCSDVYVDNYVQKPGYLTTERGKYCQP